MSRPSSPLSLFNCLILGTGLGILFIKSEVARWQRIHEMFLFEDARMYLIITTAILVAAVSMRFLKAIGAKNLHGQPVTYNPRPFHPGVVIGGLMFGAGWALTGACPGPIYAQIGAGEPLALVTFAGAMLGMYTFAALKPKLP